MNIIKRILKDELLIANLITNFFFSFAYPIVHLFLINHITEKDISMNSIICCISGIFIPIIWNKYEKMYNSYGFFLISEIICYIILCSSILLSFITPKAYYIIDTLLYAFLTRNLCCGNIKLKVKRYCKENDRAEYDNNSVIVANFSSLLGFILSYFISIPIKLGFIFITIGIIFDNFIYYYVYKKIKQK